MRFLENLVAAANIARIPFANGTASNTANLYCKALTDDRNSRCNNNDLCTFGNGMIPKYSCSQSAIEEATGIYQKNAAHIRQYPGLYDVFPEQYSDYLRDINDGGTFEAGKYLEEDPENMKVLQPILSILLYIPYNVDYDNFLVEDYYRGSYPIKELQLRDEVVEIIFKYNDHAYELYWLNIKPYLMAN